MTLHELYAARMMTGMALLLLSDCDETKLLFCYSPLKLHSLLSIRVASIPHFAKRSLDSAYMRCRNMRIESQTCMKLSSR